MTRGCTHPLCPHWVVRTPHRASMAGDGEELGAAAETLRKGVSRKEQQTPQLLGGGGVRVWTPRDACIWA